MNYNVEDSQSVFCEMRRNEPKEIKFLHKETELGEYEAFEYYLDAVPDVPPDEGDILET